LARNVAGVIRPPAVEKGEIEILTATEVATALQKLQGHELYAITSTGLATGMRRGELLAYSSAITFRLSMKSPNYPWIFTTKCVSAIGFNPTSHHG